MQKQSICLCLGLLVLLTVSISAASEFGKNQHDVELLFDLSGLDNVGLNSFDGGLGFRYYFLDGFTIRPNYSYSSQTSANLYETNDGSVYDSERYSFDLVIEKHFSIGEKFVPYLGLGYSFGELTNEETYYFDSDPEIGQFKGRRSTSESHSVLGLLGVQWQAYGNFSLGCEYRLEYRDSDAKEEMYYELENTKFRTQLGSSFNTSTSSLYIAVGF